MSPKPTTQAAVRYLSGFGNEHATESLPGTLPEGLNSTQKVAHGLYADPQFVFPILSLIVLEGTARDVCPDVDFQAEAVPFVLLALHGRR